MKESIKRRLLCGVVALLVLLPACGIADTPPEVETVESVFYENTDNINTIVRFMEASGYTDIYINETDGTMQADLEELEIEDEAVNAAISQLIGTETYRLISKRGETIEFLQWSAFIKDIGCGIIYTMDDVITQEIPYVTQLQPLKEPGWYYYVEDYELYRRQHD